MDSSIWQASTYRSSARRPGISAYFLCQRISKFRYSSSTCCYRSRSDRKRFRPLSGGAVPGTSTPKSTASLLAASSGRRSNSRLASNHVPPPPAPTEAIEVVFVQLQTGVLCRVKGQHTIPARLAIVPLRLRGNRNRHRPPANIEVIFLGYTSLSLLSIDFTVRFSGLPMCKINTMAYWGTWIFACRLPFYPRCFLTGNPARRCAVAPHGTRSLFRDPGGLSQLGRSFTCSDRIVPK